MHQLWSAMTNIRWLTPFSLGYFCVQGWTNLRIFPSVTDYSVIVSEWCFVKHCNYRAAFYCCFFPHRVRWVLSRGTSMLLCAVAADSTLVYQKLSSGLVTPDPPVDIQDQGRRQHRKRRIPPWDSIELMNLFMWPCWSSFRLYYWSSGAPDLKRVVFWSAFCRHNI